jgi:hypothetical protein
MEYVRTSLMTQEIQLAMTVTMGVLWIDIKKFHISLKA